GQMADFLTCKEDQEGEDITELQNALMTTPLKQRFFNSTKNITFAQQVYNMLPKGSILSVDDINETINYCPLSTAKPEGNSAVGFRGGAVPQIPKAD
ncbi:MAG: hypothetical protein ACOYOK_06600, partial [Pseudobdellovibrionaceae bacterium]